MLTACLFFFPTFSSPVSNDATTLVLPQVQQHFLIADGVVAGLEHALPDARQVAQVEDVVELGGRRQHLDLKHTQITAL